MEEYWESDGLETMTRIHCPKCNSLRIDGNRKRFACRKCGFVHNPFFKKILPTEAKAGMVFLENLQCLVIEKDESPSQKN